MLGAEWGGPMPNRHPAAYLRSSINAVRKPRLVEQLVSGQHVDGQSCPIRFSPAVLEPRTDPHDGPVLEHVELVALATLALCIIDVKCAITEDARKGDVVIPGEIPPVGGDGLPGEIASD